MRVNPRHLPAVIDHSDADTRSGVGVDLPRRGPVCTVPSQSGGARPGRLAVVARAGALVGAVAAVLLVCSADRAMAAEVLAAPASIDQVLTNLRNWLVGILAGLATLFLTVGGVRYVMANGDPGEIEKAKSAFRGAGIGYGLAVLAPLVVTVLQGIVGG